MSTAKQGEGVSLEAQRDAIQAFASRENLQVVRWFEEKETAAKRGRPIFNQMLRLLKRGAARGLIMHKIDRSARNLRDWSVVTELPDHGIDVHIATETLDFRSRGGRLTADIQAVIAADYIRNLREETIKGLNGRLKQGLYPFRAPIGYVDNGRGKLKTPDPIKAPLIKKMFSLYASGSYGLRSLQVEMARQGLRNHAGKPLSLNGVATVLGNPFYTGIIAIKRSGKTWRGEHPPLISARLFQQVQDRKSGKAGKKVTRHNHLFRGLFRCGHCEGPMVPETQMGHVYYRCKQATCPTKTVREEAIETAIVMSLSDLQLSEAEARKMKDSWIRRMNNGESANEQKGLQLRADECRARQNRLTDLLIDGVITATDYDQRKRSLTLELGQIEEALAESYRTEVTEADIDQFLNRLTGLTFLYQALDDDEKRRFIECIYTNSRILGREVLLQPCDWVASRKDGAQVPTASQIIVVSQALPKVLLPHTFCADTYRNSFRSSHQTKR